MKLTFLPGDLHRAARLVTESGETLAEFGVDAEFVQVKLRSGPGQPVMAEIILDLPVGNPATIIEADEQSVRALPAPIVDGDFYDDGDFFGFRDDEQEWEDAEEEW